MSKRFKAHRIVVTYECEMCRRRPARVECELLAGWIVDCCQPCLRELAHKAGAALQDLAR